MLQALHKELRLDYGNILTYFLDSEYDVEPYTYSGYDAITVSFDVNGKKRVTLVHICQRELTQLPHFYLMHPGEFGLLAHVIPCPVFEDLSSICVNQLDSVSINYERPELAFKESIKRHVELLRLLITDKNFNRLELLREFKTNWLIRTRAMHNGTRQTLYCNTQSANFNRLCIYRPKVKDSVMSLPASFVAIPDAGLSPNIARFFSMKERQQHHNSVCYVVPFGVIDPNIPNESNGLKLWLLEALHNLPKDIKAQAEKSLFAHRSKEFWLVLNIETPSGVAWFGLKLSLDKKKSFPLNEEKIKPWKIEAVFIENFNKELMLPRSGANVLLNDKNVLLVGCGSVGSEVAHKLGSAGIGRIDISDPDKFTTSNYYRHTLEGYKTDWPKSLAVASQLQDKFPWIEANYFETKLLDYRKKNLLDQYDLIVIAIGNPTHERLFHEYLVNTNAQIPVIYTWLEGYGIGGHAVIDIPGQPGCLRCAYVEPETGVRGLASNLNFIEPNQNVVKNYAGCGEMFIPYGANSSAQTALIAMDLAINYLNGKITESKKISWKGDSYEAEKEDLKLTERYRIFDSSLVKLPLRHILCDVCQSSSMITFGSECGKRLFLPNNLHNELSTYRQIAPDSLESAGLLVGYYNQNGEALIDKFTEPKASDNRTRTTYKLDPEAHQSEIDFAYKASDHRVGYIGTWHTHPQNIPVPSTEDKQDWETHVEENQDRTLFFIVVGIKETHAYMATNKEIIKMHMIEQAVEH